MSNKTDRTFECPKCKQIWTETDKKIIKCYCPICKLVMAEIKKGENDNRKQGISRS